MYQVLFAEDELLVRLGLQNAIPWGQFDMELTAWADNGEEALRLFEELRPDLVITDIRMDRMDGNELIRRIRAIDRECAIIVISCLDDFLTVKNLIPYRIIGYISKAGMSMDEIFGVLKDARAYLDGLDRGGGGAAGRTADPEALLAEYLRGDGPFPLPEESAYTELLLFSIGEKDRMKINDLAMKFVRDLVLQQIPNGLCARLGEGELCLLSKGEPPKDAVECVVRSIEGFLGVRFSAASGLRREGESPRELFRRVRRESENEQGQSRVVQSAVRYMRAHHAEPLSLADISGVLSLSPSYFSHLFKKETGKNYVEYLNEIRLEAVKEELKNTESTIAVAAENHGFQNQEYFSRLFKKSTGMSPAHWRRMER